MSKDVRKKFSEVVSLVLVTFFACTAFGYGRISRPFRGSSQNISVYSTESDGDGSYYSSGWDRSHQSQRETEWERKARLDALDAYRQYNTLVASEMVRNWPKCIAMRSDGRLCRKPCPSRRDLYCDAHRNYVLLYELYLEAFSTMMSKYTPVDICMQISDFSAVSPDMTSVVFELRDGVRFSVAHVINIGSVFAVADENGKIVAISDRRNYVDGDRIVGGRFIVCGVRRFGVAGLENTVTALRRITEREEERLRQKQEDTNARNIESIRGALLDKYQEITKKLHALVGETFVNDPDWSARMTAAIRLNADIDACHAAFSACDTNAINEVSVRLRRSWNEEFSALQTRIEQKRQAELEAQQQLEERQRQSEMEAKQKVLKSKIAETRANIAVIESFIERYKKECTNNNSAPTSLSVLVSRMRTPSMIPLRDAWGQVFDYEADGEFYIIVSAGPDLKLQTEDDISVTNQKVEEVATNACEQTKTQMQQLSEEVRKARERLRAQSVPNEDD